VLKRSITLSMAPVCVMAFPLGLCSITPTEGSFALLAVRQKAWSSFRGHPLRSQYRQVLEPFHRKALIAQLQHRKQDNQDERAELETARARSLPPAICGTVVTTVSKVNVNWPLSASACAGALPM
jgi:hypothetical protein